MWDFWKLSVIWRNHQYRYWYQKFQKTIKNYRYQNNWLFVDPYFQCWILVSSRKEHGVTNCAFIICSLLFLSMWRSTHLISRVLKERYPPSFLTFTFYPFTVTFTENENDRGADFFHVVPNSLIWFDPICFTFTKSFTGATHPNFIKYTTVTN